MLMITSILEKCLYRCISSKMRILDQFANLRQCCLDFSTLALPRHNVAIG